MNNMSASRHQFNSSKNDSIQTTINAEFEMRNLIIGVAGTMANSSAFCLVLKTNDVKSGRKVLLLNLVMSDVMTSVNMIVYGLDRSSTRLSDDDGCFPLMFFVIVSILNSVATCLLLSVVNALAVFIPFRFRTLVLWKYTGMGAAMSLLVNGGMTYWWIGHQLPPGLTCAPVVILPEKGLVGFGTMLLSGTVGVLALNSMVFGKLRNTSRSFRASRMRSGQMPRQQRAFSTDAIGGGGPECVHEQRIFSMDTMIGSGMPLPSPASSTEYKTRGVPASRMPSGETNDKDIHREAFQPNTNQSYDEPCNSDTSSSAGNRKTTRMRFGAHTPNSALSLSVNAFAQRDRICKMLIVITTYSCCLLLPVSIYVILIAAGYITDPDVMVSTPFGIFVSSCTVIKAMINPFFYVFKFVNWQNRIFKRCARAVPCT